MVEIRKKIGEEIRRIRQNNGWTQEELAKKTGYTQDIISRWESGKISPNLLSFSKLCEIMPELRKILE